MTADRRTSYGDTVDAVLGAIGSPDAAPGSGSAAVLALSTAVECLALHARLSLRAPSRAGHVQELERLLARADSWKTTLRAAFDEDARRVEAMIAARRRRERVSASERRAVVEHEVCLTAEASAGLSELLHHAEGIRNDAAWLAGGGGVTWAASESITAQALASAVHASLETMLEANRATIARRRAEYGVESAEPPCS